MSPDRLAALLAALDQVARAGIHARDAVDDGAARGLSPLRSLLENGLPLSALQTAALSVQGYDIIDLNPASVDVATMTVLPLTVSREARAVAIGRDGPGVVVAMADPSDVAAADEVRRALPSSVRAKVVVADAEAISEALRRYEASLIMGGQPADDPESGSTPPRVSLTDPREGDSRATRTTAAIITYAVSSRASDIHVYCDDRGADVRIRIDGVLHPHARIDGAAAAAALLGRIKVLGALDLGQRRLPQDGRIQVDIEGRTVDIRLATTPTIWETEDAVLRILDTTAGTATLESLGMSAAALGAWSRLWRSSHGLLLVTGPTGSGKSTTLYATLRELATPDRAVRTVEDPVEVRIPGITQVQVNHRAGLSFASALRSFLRSDPDVILVGEIRDHETARVATEAALTGHLVLATLHTSSASQVPVRLVEMGVPAYLVAASLQGAMGQRLLRRLCRDCRQVRSADQLATWPGDAGDPPERVSEMNAGGCARCAHTGYRGRLAVAEVMVVDDEIRHGIADGVTVEQLTKLAVASGMRPLREAIIDEVRSGETSLGELARMSSAGAGA